ncbi:MAG: hypothetical protein JWN29_3426 [Acidimicrobiales bacterium]|nr:hypothetical protein [Acidimicrobiales bacterium]
MVCLLASACSSGSKEAQAQPGITEQHAAQADQGDLALDVVASDEVSPQHALGPLDEVNRTAAMTSLQRTFDATVVRPVTTGKAGSIDTVFTADAAARAAGQDRAALFDEGLPRVRDLVADKANVRLTALGGDDGKPALIVAKIDWDVRSADGKVRVRRIGELSMVPVLGTWLIGAYTVTTSRTVGGSTTTTTAAK